MVPAAGRGAVRMELERIKEETTFLHLLKAVHRESHTDIMHRGKYCSAEKLSPKRRVVVRCIQTPSHLGHQGRPRT
ncbi:hypothetical protein Y1Q_0008823 [Alligator mississippiensis]|uniref:Uncharacterized protein n=1 Tax=Alligator mississippiensis TaxID=8496 RepID=A0A151NA28_ALLMI|nr:hypothetical protein Y1Q_0008823 [Alligator mississippiensis]